jgi:hypothetical protein
MSELERVARAMCWKGTLRAVGKPCPNAGCQSRQTCAAHIDGLRESEDWTTAEDAIAAIDEARGKGERVERNPDGSLDEVVTKGWAHLEHMGKGGWFLNCGRVDGSSLAIWIHGKITLTQERAPPSWWPNPPALPAPPKEVG